MMAGRNAYAAQIRSGLTLGAAHSHVLLLYFHQHNGERTESSLCLLSAVYRPPLSRNLCILCQEARAIVVDYRGIGAFSCKNPCFSLDTLSRLPVFSYT